jgi:membrane-bound metal-dependent hydrolase YbcI (DUF457 family)
VDYLFCQNCNSKRGFKRSLGIGTFLMVLITFGFWLLFIPLYPKRCLVCGQTKGAALEATGRSHVGITVALIGVIVLLFFLYGASQQTSLTSFDREHPT